MTDIINEVDIIEYYKNHTLGNTSRTFHINKNKILEILNSNNIVLHTKEEEKKIRYDQVKSTKESRYGSAGYNNRDKAHKTMIELYGGIGNASDIIKEKQQATMVEKYGSHCSFTSPELNEKIKATNLKKYGNEYYVSTEGCHGKANTKEAIEKRFNTLMEKYGWITPFSDPEVQKNLKEFWKTHPEVQDKKFKTREENGTWCSSNPEDEYYNKLVETYGEGGVIRQYKEERYPWHCDFYIPSEDLFIELNLFYMHGGHPFNPNNEEDIKQLKLIRSKQGTYIDSNGKEVKNSYYTYEFVWTDLDVRKRNTAKQNNLNYMEIF